MRIARVVLVAAAMLLFSSAVQGQHVDTLELSDPVLASLAQKSGLWAECVVGVSVVRASVLRVDSTSTAKLHQTPTGISPGCPHDSLGFIHPDTSGKCELKAEEMASWRDSEEVIRVVYCNASTYHFYMQPRMPSKMTGTRA